MKFLSRATIYLCVLGIFMGGAACERFGKRPKVKEANPLWTKYISGHTSGFVSKKSKVQILFTSQLFSDEQVGQAANNLVDVSPSFPAVITISAPDEIVIIPEKDLESGQVYKVNLHGDKIAGLPEKIGDYEFLFDVIAQAYSVELEGLTATDDAGKIMKIQGRILTADVAEAEQIQKMMSTDLPGKELTVEWSHDISGRNHSFTIKNIERSDETKTLKLAWNGSAIGVKEDEKQSIEIPGLTVFKITDIKPIQDEQQYIIVYFSDNLNSKQILKGLVEVEPGPVSYRLENNTLKIFPRDKFVGKITVTVSKEVKNGRGDKLKEDRTETIVFASQKPQVKFAGKGVILPENDVLSIPVETMNVHSVQVAAFRIFPNNIGQFLQTNKLDGSSELNRVGRSLWRKTIHLPTSSPDAWQRFNLDASELVKRNPGGLFQLTLSINRSNSSYSCSEEENAVSPEKEKPVANNEDLYVQEYSSWDYAEDYYGQNSTDWRDREDPCKDAYYRYGQQVKTSRNFMASNIGLIAKGDEQGQLNIVATNIRTADPMDNVELSILNFQDQVIGTGKTDGAGMARIELKSTPFYLVAKKGNDIGYLKINQATALPMTHFDVGGQKVESGVKGTVYGERGVWRPGDDLHLVFVLEDKTNALPKNHPVTMRLINPQGQLFKSLTNNEPVDGFYKFTFRTHEDSPTGNWSAVAQLGDRSFSQRIPIETIIPNRLKIELDFKEGELHQSQMPVKGQISSQWLHGAPASGLKTDVEVKLKPISTSFNRFSDHHFDDPAKEFEEDGDIVFEGNLSGEGKTDFNLNLNTKNNAPGKMMATFTTRVFEQGGAFSSSRQSMAYHPYKNYIGLKLPKGDQTRGMLLTDVKHPISIASLNSKGEPVSVDKVKISVYKIGWKWWWDKSEESLARYISANYNSTLLNETISTKDGKGSWDFEIKYPSWGRYLVRACDETGGHCAGEIVYIDWPGWSGRAQEEGGPAASILSIQSDKDQYTVGEKATIQLPEATQGRALISIENGSRVLENRWIVFSEKNNKFDFKVTSEMSPNVYVSVTLIQPHQGKDNDRPIRLYGVVPIKVEDPSTRLEPVLKAADEWEPETKVEIHVSEKQGRPMTYTLAVVDEGLLGLTNFKTPDLHSFFYRKEALGVTTWDMFDFVVGAYGGQLERLLALGGGDALEVQEVREQKRRFPPVVRFMGPFSLGKNETKNHKIDLPQYVGAVRVMVVAGKNGAYGNTEKSVFVRQALTILTTLPRILRPNEIVNLPVSVFVNDKAIKDVALSLQTNEFFEAVNGKTTSVQFKKPGESMGFFKLKVGSKVGQGSVLVLAESGSYKSKSTIDIQVLPPNPPTTRAIQKEIEAGSSWTGEITPHGLPGTNEVVLELSSVPPLNLEKNLHYLIRYPHGCVEQITSSVFPQLHLASLLKLEKSQKENIDNNIAAGIEKLRRFQETNGAFVYWPGGFYGGEPNMWATNYVGHFLVEADKAGHHVPAEVMSDWLKFQSSRAQAWDQNTATALEQSYRLYTLALAGKPELGAMNRMREMSNMPNPVMWQLAAAYKMAGVHEAAEDLAKKAKLTVEDYNRPGATYGSSLRDKALILEGLTHLKKSQQGLSVAKDITVDIGKRSWYSTQEMAFCLLALAKFYGADGSYTGLQYEYQVADQSPVSASADKPIIQVALKQFPEKETKVRIQNKGDKKIFATVIARGVPAAGEEISSANDLSLSVEFTTLNGRPLDVTNLTQGTDIEAKLIVKNTSTAKIEEIALVQMAPSGWEIHNPRMSTDDASTPKDPTTGKQTNPFTWWWQNYDKKNPGAQVEYQDIRDDRINSYFDLESGQSIEIRARFNAAYLGRYYMPGVSVEAMYEGTKQARQKGSWVNVEKSNR